MLPYSFRLALRHFARKKVYSSIIVLSLTVGFACTCLLVSFLISETSADSFHAKKDRLVELVSNDPFSVQGKIVYTTRRTRDYLIDHFGEVENICQLTNVDKAETHIDGNVTPLKAIGVDGSFFEMFDFPLIAGSTRITDNTVVFTEEKALQLFGTTDVLGRAVNVRTSDTTKLVSIVGIIGKAREKSHLKFDALVPNGLFEKIDPFLGGVSYMLIRDNVDIVTLNQKINSDPNRPTLLKDGELDYLLVPIKESYTASWNRFPFMQTRSETFIWVGWMVCGLILFMAGFNFANLFLLSMQERRKEAGIQKTLGISLWLTLRSAMTEAGIYIGVSLVLSLVFAYSLMPIFGSMLRANVGFNYLSRLNVMSIVVGLVFLLAIIIVLAVTIHQRRVLPVSMMRNVSAKVKFSGLFFTLQFFVSITLCICCMTIIKQMKFVETAPLGFNKNILQLNPRDNGPIQQVGNLKTKISELAGVEHTAQSSGNPISGNMILMMDLGDGRKFTPYMFEGDESLAKTLELRLIEGSLDFKAPGDRIVNETLTKTLGLKDPIGAKIPGGEDSRIIGVVKDFTCSSFKNEIPPVIISYRADAKNLLIDYGQSDINILLPKIKAVWQDLFADDNFDYVLLQDDLMKKYSEETLFYKVVLAASITSMIISCFGLFALSWAVIRSRSKEMGIRKVLGATVTNILGLLTASFAKRLLIAFALAAPMGYYLMNLWLSRFAYKAPIDGWVFVLTGAALATIAIVTLGFQTLKASLSSPLEEIRE